jgi:hypothetical protein
MAERTTNLPLSLRLAGVSQESEDVEKSDESLTLGLAEVSQHVMRVTVARRDFVGKNRF